MDIYPANGKYFSPLDRFYIYKSKNQMKEESKDQEIAGWVMHYLHREISEVELEQLYQWLQESPENKDSFFRMKSTYDAIRHRSLMSAEEIENSWLRMRSKMTVAGEILPPRSQGRIFPLRLFSYMAVAAVAALLGLGISQYTARHTLPADPASAEISYNEVHVRKGGRPCLVTLSDGTKVQLNVAGTLRYPAGFSGDSREVFLDGEAWFEVVHDRQKRFIVHLRQQDIIVHGTRFNVEAYPEEPCNTVTLLDGSISLESSGNKGEPISRIFLKPGQMASFHKTSGHVSIEKTDATMANAWIRGEFRFKDEPLSIITKRLENYYNLKITVDCSLEDIRYTGSFSFNQSITQVLNIINHEKQFYFRQKNEHEIWIRKK
jgi:ferric-dicitrate binding protein FerR (iron transport regulator)